MEHLFVCQCFALQYIIIYIQQSYNLLRNSACWRKQVMWNNERPYKAKHTTWLNCGGESRRGTWEPGEVVWAKNTCWSWRCNKCHKWEAESHGETWRWKITLRQAWWCRPLFPAGPQAVEGSSEVWNQPHDIVNLRLAWATEWDPVLK